MLRRTLLAAAPLLLLPKAAGARTPIARSSHLSGGTTSGQFTNFVINSTFSYNSNYPPNWVSGDGIAPTWSDDGNTYIILNDTNGGGFNGTGPGRIEVCSLNGYTSSLVGTNISGFPALSSTWYLGGLLAVGSTLYLTLSDNGSGSPGIVNQMVKSTDHGVTWTPPAPYSSTIWTGHYPIGFVQYGQAYTGNGPHNSNLYVYLYFYATSAPPNGQSATLGRCLLTNITNLVGTDWSWYQGGDGMLDANWGAYSTSAAVFTETTANPAPYYFLTGTAQYLPAFNCYIFTQNHYVGGSASNSVTNYYSTPTPWGPYTLVASINMSAYGALYQITAAGASVAVDGGRTLVLMGSGDYEDCCTMTGRYCLHLVNASLS
jgi:hypothetical protein